MFHEVFASGPPWRSAFWIGGVQAWITRAVARLSNAVWTNSRYHGDWLRGAVAEPVPLYVRPVFSNVGEPASVRPPRQRAPGLVIFGAQSTRQRALALLKAHIDDLRALDIASITEAGAGHASVLSSDDIRHDDVGRPSAQAIGELLQSHRFALIDYPSPHLGKSGVFAAYVVHGCVVLNTARADVDADGLQSGRHYLTLRRGVRVAAGGEDHEAMAYAARAWYGDHTLHHQAAELLAVLISGSVSDRGLHEPPRSRTRRTASSFRTVRTCGATYAQECGALADAQPYCRDG